MTHPTLHRLETSRVGPVLFRQVRAFGWTMIGTLATQIATYLTLVLLTRQLGIADYGRYIAIQATLYGAFGVANLGTGITATRFVAKFAASDPLRAARILRLSGWVATGSGLLFSLVVALGSGTIATRILERPELAAPLRFSSIACLLLTVNANWTGALMGLESFGALMRAQTLQGLFAVASTTTLVAGFGFTGAVASLPLNALVGGLLLRHSLSAECRRHGIPSTVSDPWREHSTLHEFALPAATSGWLASLSIWGGQMMLVRSDSGLAALAGFAVAQSIRAVLLLAPGVLSRVSGPILSTLYDSAHPDDYRRAFWRTSGITAASATGLGLLLWLVSPWLLPIFGKDFTSVSGVLPWCLASGVLEAYASSVSIALLADGRLFRQVLIMSAWGITLLGLAWWWIPSLGPVGLAAAYCGAWALASAVYTVQALALENKRTQ